MTKQQLDMISSAKGGQLPMIAGCGVPFKVIAKKISHLFDSVVLSEFPPEEEAASLLGYEYASRYCALPLNEKNGIIRTAMCDPFCVKTISDIYEITGLKVEPVYADESDIRFYINKIFDTGRIKEIASQFESDEKYGFGDLPIHSAPAVRLVDSLIESAVYNRASDIHIEPAAHEVVTRFRIDGRLVRHQSFSKELLPNIVSRIKVLGIMNIAEHRLPQDGHFNMSVRGKPVDFRVSTLPTLYGEKAVIRLLYDNAVRMKTDELGFFPDDLEILQRLFLNPYGAVFITGPTGSGKSTTLNSFLTILNDESKNIVTVEDPVESPIDGVNHVRVAPDAGLVFSNALRGILRQDPDIIMIGEIRDAETAKIAMQAAITGHLVLSTVHTNDAAGVFTRLVDMHVEPYLAAAALNGVISQRLVRRICPHCKYLCPVTAEQARFLPLEEGEDAYDGRGCNLCGHAGYHGRFAVYEYIVFDEDLREQLTADRRGSAAVLRANSSVIVKNGVRNIRAGGTSAAEVIRALYRP
ncbi:MAG: GspE/PulE family protein [Defluviitaleaceae bacterium]|nr:GspE/PulE family protein [Defluviitaleaceae bacterium]